VVLIRRFQEIGLDLIENDQEKDAYKDWWGNLSKRRHLLFSLSVSMAFTLFSLLYNANSAWSRYTDALGIFYMGFFVGEATYLIALSPLANTLLKNYRLKLTPLDPARTVNLRNLAEITFNIALITGVSLLVMNMIIALASFIFRHLIAGVVLLSVIAWIIIIILAIYPHVIFWQIVRNKKEETLRALEKRITEQYTQIVMRGKQSQSMENLLKMHELVLTSKAFPISNTEFFGLLTALLLNVIPAILRYLV